METTVQIEQGDLIALLEIARVALTKWPISVGDAVDLSDDELIRLREVIEDAMAETV